MQAELPSTIDTSFDVREDTPPGKDPDRFSPTLRRYHRMLWSKPLPGGGQFTLDASTSKAYLYHQSSLGEFLLASDSAIPTFIGHRSLANIVEQVPLADLEAFNRLTYTIGGMMIFPGNQVNRQRTINGARGCHPRIKDRFDLTIECIRRHYGGDSSPLSDVLARYDDYFRLFESFHGYVEFFLLQDLVDPAFSTVHTWAPFDDFTTSPLPATVELYLQYRDAALEFVEKRNSRIREYCRMQGMSAVG